MFRPLSETEKMAALRDGAVGALEELKRREAQMREIRQTVHAVWGAFVTAPMWEVVQAPLPADMTSAPFEELWSVKPKVTFE